MGERIVLSVHESNDLLYGVQEPGGGRLFRASSDPNLRKEGTVRLEPGDPSHGLTPQYAARSQVSATCISF